MGNFKNDLNENSILVPSNYLFFCFDLHLKTEKAFKTFVFLDFLLSPLLLPLNQQKEHVYLIVVTYTHP